MTELLRFICSRVTRESSLSIKRRLKSSSSHNLKPVVRQLANLLQSKDNISDTKVPTTVENTKPSSTKSSDPETNKPSSTWQTTTLSKCWNRSQSRETTLSIPKVVRKTRKLQTRTVLPVKRRRRGRVSCRKSSTDKLCHRPFNSSNKTESNRGWFISFKLKNRLLQAVKKFRLLTFRSNRGLRAESQPIRSSLHPKMSGARSLQVRHNSILVIVMYKWCITLWPPRETPVSLNTLALLMSSSHRSRSCLQILLLTPREAPLWSTRTNLKCLKSSKSSWPNISQAPQLLTKDGATQLSNRAHKL